MKSYDVIILGAGAAGLSAAATISPDKKVAIIDMGNIPARKIAISGGGHCNFTNDAVSYERYFGSNPKFVRGIITNICSKDILDWAKSKCIKWYEKTPGQYFCETSAKSIINPLIQDAGNADLLLNEIVIKAEKIDELFIIHTTKNIYSSKSLIVATGGISFPATGVSDIGYKIAKHFGHKIIPVRPALCAITTKIIPSELSGISINVEIKIGKSIIQDSLLFTHFGLGGPAMYRTTVRDLNDDIHINLLPNINVYDWLRNEKQTSGKKSIFSLLATKLPNRLAKWLAPFENKNLADYKDAELKSLSEKINNFIIHKNEFSLYNLQSAEVVRGGVSTDEISPKTMESKLCPGLFFAGEVVDIAGDLGGFNLHWAFASGRTAGMFAQKKNKNLFIK